MNPALIERLQHVRREAEAAGHGKKSAVYQQAAAELGMSVPTLQRKLKDVSMSKPRKKRSDAGASCITLDELRMISAYMRESHRNQGKKLASLELAVEVLRSNGSIVAGRLNTDTGELEPASVSTISRALMQNGLHPKQLAQPTPKQRLASKHPNHVWQIDPSLCVLYYMPTRRGQSLQVMEEQTFYKNKPGNIRKIEKERVWRYVITDHTSGWIYVHYVLGAETGQNLCEAFIHAMQKRGPNDPVHGVPLMVMVDPGSANTGAMFKNLCRTLGVEVQVNRPGQPWAKGQVEKANDIVECHFEHRLRVMRNPPTSLEEINAEAWKWMAWYNATQTHRRTNDTRFNVWMRITAEQLRIAPPVEVLRELAVSAPETRKVSPQMTISYKGKTFSVVDVPDVCVGETVTVTRNPWRDDDSAQVVYTDADGREVIQVIEADRNDQFGFPSQAPVIGEEYKGMPDTRSDKERKAIERVVMGATTDAEAEAARKKKAVPFGGDIDPMKPVNDTELTTYIRKRGTDLDISAPKVELRPLSHVEAAKKLREALGSAWTPDSFAWLKQRHPDGVPETEIPAIITQLSTPAVAATPLRVIN